MGDVLSSLNYCQLMLLTRNSIEVEMMLKCHIVSFNISVGFENIKWQDMHL